MPTCTIIIPTHNRDDLLIRAVNSAMQACPIDGEILVVDDKSTVPAAKVLSWKVDSRLRTAVNTGPKGAANTRNLGVRLARSELIFFLDDDDEMLPDYCGRVMAPCGPASIAEWGFSSVIEFREDLATENWRQRKRLARGMVPRAARPKDMIAAISEGFWIRKTIFQAVGGFDPQQSIDEDTDLCVRLVALLSQPWYEPKPGTIVHGAHRPSWKEGAQLTASTPIVKGLECYRRTHDKNVASLAPSSPLRWFLATRYMRRAVKTGQVDDAIQFAKKQAPWLYAQMLMMYVKIKQLKHR
jgi:glycosyltransferase involved in cell wall biosynthesis